MLISAHGTNIPRKKYNWRRLPSAVDRSQSLRRPVRQSIKGRLGMRQPYFMGCDPDICD